MNYFYSVRDGGDGSTYTVDMIRFHCHIVSSMKSNIESWLDTTCYSKKWSGSGFGKFALNWNYSSLWFGLGTKNEGKFVLIAIEFNPNKMSKDEWFIFYRFLDIFKLPLDVKRFDLAVDVPYNINDIKFLSLNKRSFSLFYSDYNNKTYYMGKGNGHIKIYNKKLESELESELTRFEVTREVDFPFQKGMCYDIDFCFPLYTFSEFTYDKSLGTDDTLDVIQYSLNNGFPFQGLSRSYKSYFRKNLPKEGHFNNGLANLVFWRTIDLLLDKKPLI